MTTSVAQVATGPSLSIALITAGDVRVEYMASVIEALETGRSKGWFYVGSGPYLDIGRNKASRFFLDESKNKNDFMLFVDSDIQFRAEDIKALLDYAIFEHDETGIWPLVGGAYMSVYDGKEIVVAYNHEDPTNPESQMQPLDPWEMAPHFDPCDIDGMGTGFMLIHREILENVRQHYINELPQEMFAEINVNHHWVGEDLTFCARARYVGHPCVLHRGVRLIHWKVIGLVLPGPDYVPRTPAQLT